MSVTVRTMASHDAGGCNACEVSAAHPVYVRNIVLDPGQGHTLSLRLCAPCATDLVHQLGTENAQDRHRR